MKQSIKGNEKPVWRVASGKLPHGVNDVAYIYRGEIYKGWVAHRWICVHDWYHVGRSSGAFYNTTRTKTAKYERVGCLWCENGRIQDFRYKGKMRFTECGSCNGKGYRLERIK